MTLKPGILNMVKTKEKKVTEKAASPTTAPNKTRAEFLNN